MGAPSPPSPTSCHPVPGPPPASAQMEALNVEVLHPQLLSSADELGAGARRHLAAMAGGSLEAVLQVGAAGEMGPADPDIQGQHAFR